MKTLPEFLNDCYRDFCKIEQRPNVEIDMSWWASVDGGTCTVCMGGAYLLNRVGEERLQRLIDQTEKNSICTTAIAKWEGVEMVKILNLLDSLRLGFVSGIERQWQGLHEADPYRYAAFEGTISEAESWVSYKDDPSAWHSNIVKLLNSIPTGKELPVLIR